MPRIRPDVRQLCPALVIEAMHQFGIAPQCFGRAHIRDTMPFPKPIRPAKGGDYALCGNSSAGQDNDDANVFNDRHEARTKGRFQDMTKLAIYGESRSEELRQGKETVSTRIYRWCTSNQNKKQKLTNK